MRKKHFLSGQDSTGARWPPESFKENASNFIDPHAAYLAGMPLGEAMENYKAARVKRAQRKAQRRQTLALLVPVLAFAAAVLGKGFVGSGLQQAVDALTGVFAAAGRGELAAAAAATYDAFCSLADSNTAKKLLLPIFLTVVLRIARQKVIDSLNGGSSGQQQQQQQELSPAAANLAELAAASAAAKAARAAAAESAAANAPAAAYEWPRRLQHSLSGFVIIGVYMHLPFFYAFAFVVAGQFLAY